LEAVDTGIVKQVPIEDLGVVVLDHQQITITHTALYKLLENNTSVICTNDKHHPIGVFMHLDGQSTQSARYAAQIAVNQPIKKQLWAQTIRAKLLNQGSVLKHFYMPYARLQRMAIAVKSGDTGNLEAQGAAYYWRHLFGDVMDWERDRYGIPPNNMLNYSYAILRAATARAISMAGLHPTLGIFHKNKYNAYCLADDLMEPYRPYIDRYVKALWENDFPGCGDVELSQELRHELLKILQIDVHYTNKVKPLTLSLNTTAASLAHCYLGRRKTILFPLMKYEQAK